MTVKFASNKGDAAKNLMIELNQKQLDYASNVRDQRSDKDTQTVADWLYRHSKNFVKMPQNLLLALAQQTFVVPKV